MRRSSVARAAWTVAWIAASGCGEITSAPPPPPSAGPPVIAAGPELPAAPPPAPVEVAPAEAPAPSAPVIQPGATAIRGSLSREAIRGVIRANIGQVRYCYERELARDPALSGRVEVSFIISANGTVQTAAILNTTLRSPRVESCITDAVRRWVFPPPEGGGVVGVNYPFVLTSEPEEEGETLSAIEPEPEEPPRRAPTRAELHAAMEAVRADVAACATDQHGVLPVRVTFGPEGRVTAASVVGAFAGTEAEQCAIRALRGASVPPFEGDAVSFNFPFRI